MLIIGGTLPTLPTGTQVTVPVRDSLSANPVPLTPTLSTPIPAVQAGSIITIDTGANQETVTVLGVQSNAGLTTIMANFKKSHARGVPVYATMFANPGPLMTFDLDTNTALVPYYTILD
jgi:hypothetical protein